MLKWYLSLILAAVGTDGAQAATFQLQVLPGTNASFLSGTSNEFSIRTNPYAMIGLKNPSFQRYLPSGTPALLPWPPTGDLTLSPGIAVMFDTHLVSSFVSSPNEFDLSFFGREILLQEITARLQLEDQDISFSFQLEFDSYAFGFLSSRGIKRASFLARPLQAEPASLKFRDQRIDVSMQISDKVEVYLRTSSGNPTTGYFSPFSAGGMLNTTFLLHPVPEPSSLAFFLAGVSCVHSLAGRALRPHRL